MQTPSFLANPTESQPTDITQINFGSDTESGNKVVLRDDKIAAAIGLKIEADKNLPDLILADLGPAEQFIIFVEVVATDGAVTSRRRDAIFQLTDAAVFHRRQIAFLTAYQDRESAGFKKTVAQLAWNTFAWFVSEPNHLIAPCEGNQGRLWLAEIVVSKDDGSWPAKILKRSTASRVK